MKKIFKLLVFLTFLCFSILGCRGTTDVSSEEINQAEVYIRINAALNGVELTTLSDVTRESSYIGLQLFNDTDHSIVFAQEFVIDYYNNGVWTVVAHDDIAFTDEGYFLEPGQVERFERYLSIYFNETQIPAGKYRLRMPIFNEADIPITDSDFHDAFVIFTVE